MNAEVVDTNVLLVANGQHLDISPECVIRCAQRLQQLKSDKILVVDDGYEIVREYQNKLQRQNAVGWRKALTINRLPAMWVITVSASSLKPLRNPF